jgi:hypothetical protein
MSRPCIVCSHPSRQAIDALIDTGASDYEIGRRFSIERVSVGRHRREHVIKPAQDRLAILAKGTAERRERQELAAAAASDTPSIEALIEATLGLRRQMEKLTSIEQRLERMATLAEGAGSSAGVAALAAQQFRGIETGARLAGIGGYAPPRSPVQVPEGKRWTIQMVFPNAGKVEEIRLSEAPDRPAAEQPMARPVGTRSPLEIDVPQAPPEIDAASLRSCGAITPEVDEKLIERLVYRQVPDEQAEE